MLNLKNALESEEFWRWEHNWALEQLIHQKRKRIPDGNK